MVLVVYTYQGDLDINGEINADDYARIDAGSAQQLTGYTWGDIDYSGGSPGPDDYFQIDRSFSDQSWPLVGEAQALQADAVLLNSQPALSQELKTPLRRRNPAKRPRVFSNKTIKHRGTHANAVLDHWKDLLDGGRPGASLFWTSQSLSRRLS